MAPLLGNLERRLLVPSDRNTLVIGGIIGSGIFINPYVVARHVHTPALILGVWAAGGAIALIGAFIYAELAALRPEVGGQYAYLRDAWHPSVAFMDGWALLLVIQSGGMAAVSVTFARYALTLTGVGMPEGCWRPGRCDSHADQLLRRPQRHGHADRADVAQARGNRHADRDSARRRIRSRRRCSSSSAGSW